MFFWKGRGFDLVMRAIDHFAEFLKVCVGVIGRSGRLVFGCVVGYVVFGVIDQHAYVVVVFLG